MHMSERAIGPCGCQKRSSAARHLFSLVMCKWNNTHFKRYAIQPFFFLCIRVHEQQCIAILHLGSNTFNESGPNRDEPNKPATQNARNKEHGHELRMQLGNPHIGSKAPCPHPAPLRLEQGGSRCSMCHKPI